MKFNNKLMVSVGHITGIVILNSVLLVLWLKLKPAAAASLPFIWLSPLITVVFFDYHKFVFRKPTWGSLLAAVILGLPIVVYFYTSSR